MTPIDHVVFDIGHILVHYDPTIPFQRIIPDDAERQWFFDHVCTSAWNIEQDRGRRWEEAEAELIAVYPDHSAQIRAFRAHWSEMVPRSIAPNVTIFEQMLADGVDVTLLTNFAADTFVEAQEKFPFLKKGRGVTVSGRVKLIKPDPAIYALHNDAFGLKPGRTLFIDDSLPNIEAARAHGWHGIHLPPGEDLQAALAHYEIRS